MHPQTLSQGAVIQVLAVPFASLTNGMKDKACAEQREKQVNQKLWPFVLRVDQEHQAHHDGQQMDHHHSLMHPLLEMDGQPIGLTKQTVDPSGPAGQRKV